MNFSKPLFLGMKVKCNTVYQDGVPAYDKDSDKFTFVCQLHIIYGIWTQKPCEDNRCTKESVCTSNIFNKTVAFVQIFNLMS